jgi:hypothetical protein
MATMQRITRNIASLLAGTILATTTGCYSVTVQGASIDKPVSVSHSIGRRAKPVTTFKKETVTWFILGLVPMFTMPGSVSAGADRLSQAICEDELRRQSKGIIDLKVTTQNDVMSWAMGLIPSIFGLGAIFQPVSVIVEGTVVD